MLRYSYKFYKDESPQYLFKLAPLRYTPYTNRNTENIFKIQHPFSKQNFLKKMFFPSAVIEWNRLDNNIRNVGGFSAFKSNILKFIRPTPYNVLIVKTIRKQTYYKTKCWPQSFA